tara:strand:+ start:35225 stop:36811 length:1587 start_codon:yes stop_codon:yes gene_type:complete
MKNVTLKFTRILLLVLISVGTIMAQESGEKKKIILLAGAKSHQAGHHEYIKTVRLIKVMLDNSNVENLETEIYYNGWPEDESVLYDADLIFNFSDGYDGKDGTLFKPVAFRKPERMKVLESLVNRGCGFITMHFSTFIRDKEGEKVLDWGGGYFDWQGANGEKEWYSSIKTIIADIKKESLGKHPITNGVEPFSIKEEFYYNIRFRENDDRLKPILTISELETEQENGKVVAWAVERDSGGRGFGTSMGHYYKNWENENYRKLLLNAIVWTAGVKVPKIGVKSKFYNDKEVTRFLFGKSHKTLILTGNHHPGHHWKETTSVLEGTLENDSQIKVDISTNIEDLSQYNIADYDVLLMNYCNWEDAKGISTRSKQALINYMKRGGGLVIVHFANGAFHYSLPKANESDWPEYRKIVPRVWDHGVSGHDNYGEFTVNIVDTNHGITQGIKSFKTVDELYFNQAGETPITPLLTATSKKTGKVEPLAWTHQYENGRVFQILLGHSAESLEIPEVMQIIKRGALWSAGNLKVE